MKTLIVRAVTGCALLCLVPAVFAAGEHDRHNHAAPAVADSAALSEGVIKKLDAAAGKLTLIHGPIANLAMPAMTMVFKLKSPASVGKLKEGDRVRFHAEDDKGALVITRIEAAK
jgi:Cu/Ag efflux protein CusF